ncbi:UvrD-helicase domain-containing protein [Neobacillus mesonae]|nr:UvrD-helicase domain-containing protein [Neobacillus mesonae]
MHNMSPIFHLRPLGVTGNAWAPKAKPAPEQTSLELVSDHEEDAYFFRSLEKAGIILNGPQIKAVRHGRGPLLTLAGAGCGKTTVLTARTGYLIQVANVPAGSILLVTFTSKAAGEMKSRIASIPGVRSAAARAVQARTFHSFALMLLRHYGMTEDIFGDTKAQHTIIKMIQRKHGLSDAFQPESLLSSLSAWKMEGRIAEDLPDSSREEREVKQILLGYEAWKKERHKMDFDDILLHANRLLSDPGVLRPLQQRFQYIMVDEFQDTNGLQYEIVRKLAAAHRNLMVVGDDDQTIYTFNGARQEVILEFDKMYPGAKIVTLDINYRSDAHILGLGTEIIRYNKKRRYKKLVSAGSPGSQPLYATPAGAEEEAALVVSHLQEQVEAGQHAYKDIAILHRTASSSRAMFEQLVLKDIPFIQHGAGPVFYDQTLVKPLIDHLRLSLNPRNLDAISSTLGPLYISRDAGLDYMKQQEKQQAKKYPLIHFTRWDKLKPFQQEAVKERIKLIKMLASMTPLAAIQEMRRQFYDAYMESGDPNIYTHYRETMLETLDELETAVKRFETVESFVSFADELSRRHREMESLQAASDSDAVQLMTIHRSKGLEFPCVYLIGASEGILPHSSALTKDAPEDRKAALSHGSSPTEVEEALLEEERRLAYVAVTRAKKQLFITSPASQHGKPAPVSRFLLEAFGIKDAASKRGAMNERKPHAKEGSGYKEKSNHRSGEASQQRMETVPVWSCTSGSCPAWIRQHPAKEKDKPPACPLCKSVMEKSTREVPATPKQHR